MYRLYREAEGRLVYWGKWNAMHEACRALVELHALTGARCVIKDSAGEIVADTEGC